MQVQKSSPALHIRAVLTKLSRDQRTLILLPDQSSLREQEDFQKSGKRKETAIEVLFVFPCLNSSLFSSILRFTVQDLLLSTQLFHRLCADNLFESQLKHERILLPKADSSGDHSCSNMFVSKPPFNFVGKTAG